MYLLSRLVFIAIMLCAVHVWAGLQDLKYNTAQWVYFKIVDGTDGITAKTGVTYNQAGIAVGYEKSDLTTATFTLSANACTATAGNWCEVSATTQEGVYRLYVASTVFDQKGVFNYTYEATGHKKQSYQTAVRTYLAYEESDKFPSSGTIPNTTTVMTANPGSGGITTSSFASGAIDNAAFNVTENLNTTIGAGGITSATFAAGAIDAAAIATDAIGAAEIASSALAKGTEITGFNDLSAAQVNAEVDTALDTAIPGTNTVNSVNDILLDQVGPRLPGSGTLSILGVTDNIGINWGDITNTTTSQVLSGTSIDDVTGTVAEVVTLLPSAILASSIGVDAITASAIAANAIGSSEIATDAIGATEMAANSIGTSEISVSLQERMAFVKVITVSGTGSTINSIESSNLTETSSKNYVGMWVWSPSNSDLQNRNIILKVITFTPGANPKITLSGNYNTIPGAGDEFYLYVSTVR